MTTIMADQGPRAERLLTRGEVASLFRVDPRTVDTWRRNGRLAAVRTPGGQHRFVESVVRSLLPVEVSA